MLPLTAGIIIQWYWQAALLTSVLILLLTSVVVISIQLLSDFLRLKYAVLLGCAITISIVAIGMIVTWLNDVRNDRLLFAKNNLSDKAVIVTIKESLISKEKSYKAEAELNWFIGSHTRKSVSGNIIIYFKKDSLTKHLAAGSRIIFNKNLQEIRNTDNPGGFDYKRYALFNGITHQVYLTANDYVALPGNYLPGFKKLLLNVRVYVLNAIKSNIHGKKNRALPKLC
ncbi:DUF4131 domain-containing protein [Niabella ginsengisoli]|uniref:DUF4131 domain-containing protein n=1 Tax=Niabella ginsengisoli TaxID=522298 RepID=A0ABS9SQ03_9BACT|nr:DUF4131 domain-containing protein [Niabella ginsengisoli]MCH5600450.1 DUF4131 domain-containing protein [Niabella ginsengisoli]